jgi:tagatose 1,6-diphosphate aldolase
MGMAVFPFSSRMALILPCHNVAMKLSEGKLKRMKALANQRGVIAAAAMDQRGSLQKSLAVARGVSVKEITPAMMSEFKVRW